MRDLGGGPAQAGRAGRWASRTRAGRRTASPSDVNAHPHTDADGRVAVVHNGIIENADELRAGWRPTASTFVSETDTEVLAHLIARSDEPRTLEDAVRDALRRVVGTYGLAVVDAAAPDRLVVARNGSPVVIGIGDREMFVASDVAALVRHTQQVVHLDDGELATVRPTASARSTLDAPADDQGAARSTGGVRAGYDRAASPTIMRKEIAEQPQAVEGHAARAGSTSASAPPTSAA